ncbi:PREDICTED: glycosyltransferase family 92 protein Os08g0121900 [Ipomoea nil]|uniref:glycosyltransferase family 92 protein Os08g0121900 n=1 Tax=Ipomoea nil TaxID=35883 RepID=UPI0009009DA1|nr:PREDICTED: glycosyltransferase family 92 protein Os08g0121900 [Ipomoea nil]
MARKGRGNSAYVVVSLLIFFGLLYNRCIYHAAVSHYAVHFSGVAQPRTTKSAADFTANKLITENFRLGAAPGRRVVPTAPSIPAVSVAVPDYEVFVVASPEYSPLSWDEDDPYVCLFEQGETSPAIPVGVLPFPDRSLFKCEYPGNARRRKVTKQPILTLSSSLINFTSSPKNSQPPLLQWNFLAYDSITTENDVVLFVKGVNNRQGINRNPSEFRCVFFLGDETIKTNVTSSIQEVFRCKLPEFPAGKQLIKVSLEIVGPNPVIVPTVTFYNPPLHLAEPGNRAGKSKLCAATMVYNVAKNLKEWVMYHSRIGVERFILYDNNSDDELPQTVKNLVHQQQQEGIDITTYFWPWPKTQESGFSHSTVYANSSCSWMIFTDVDEFLYSKSWDDFKEPSRSLLRSVLPETGDVAQLSVPCLEFGPSNRTSHPPAGVTQGYNCRRRRDNRHKSIVLLDAVDSSLANVIHHFELKPGFKTAKVKLEDMAVNHYKYQAWPEFKAKFRRRVSAYVIDWTRQENPNSNDRTPGLGYRPVEPEGWPMRFCEVYDEGLKLLTRRWFGVESPAGLRLAWQSR